MFPTRRQLSYLKIVLIFYHQKIIPTYNTNTKTSYSFYVDINFLFSKNAQKQMPYLACTNYIINRALYSVPRYRSFPSCFIIRCYFYIRVSIIFKNLRFSNLNVLSSMPGFNTHARKVYEILHCTRHASTCRVLKS